MSVSVRSYTQKLSTDDLRFIFRIAGLIVERSPELAEWLREIVNEEVGRREGAERFEIFIESTFPEIPLREWTNPQIGAALVASAMTVEIASDRPGACAFLSTVRKVLTIIAANRLGAALSGESL